MKSIISFPNRGHWGDSRWRGNCSGHVIRELVEHYRPKLFVDACEGSGTSGDVCREMGVQYFGLDLHKGQDYTRDMILRFLPRQADVVFSHPAYFNMIDYGKVGTFADPSLVERDHSRSGSLEEFLELSQTMLLNQRIATREGGVYCTLIGDMRKGGKFHSFQSDFIQLMPKDELVGVVIKAQHNCVSDARQYGGSFIPILHEYLLVWEKKKKTMLAITLDKANELHLVQSWTWKNLVRLALMNTGGKADLPTLYRVIARMTEAEANLEKNQNWTAKVRQVLQRHFTPVERGVWALAA